MLNSVGPSLETPDIKMSSGYVDAMTYSKVATNQVSGRTNLAWSKQIGSLLGWTYRSLKASSGYSDTNNLLKSC